MPSNASKPAGTRPLIGLTTYREQARCLVWDTEFTLLHASYADAITDAGGIAVLLPPQPDAGDLIARLDGLLLSGGADISPDRYGQAPHAQTSGTRPGRDDWEARLLRQALAAGLPVLGICRGAQLLNVELGGTIEQHLPDVTGHEKHRPAPGVFGQTEVRLAPGSRTATLIGPDVKVQCHHHQAIGRLADGLRAVGHSPDGTVEAVEMPGRPFVLAVQWHPEQDHASDPRLFEALVRAAHAHSAEGTPA